MNNPYNRSSAGGSQHGSQNGSVEPRRFSVILSARGNDQPPSDLEYALRGHCKKMLTKPPKNLSGAHLLLSIEKIAIRAYYPFDLEQIQDNNISGGDDDDFDGLSKFLKSFKRSLVMFVLPQHHPVFSQQLDDTHSYFHRAQRLVGDYSVANTDKTIQVLLFPDTAMAVDGLLGFVRSFKPEILEKKKQHFSIRQESFLIPLPAQDKEQHERMREIAGRRAANAFQKLCRNAEFPMSEDKQLMDNLPTLESIVRADFSTLDRLPLERRSIDFLLSFFGSAPMPQMDQGVGLETRTAPMPRMGGAQPETHREMQPMQEVYPTGSEFFPIDPAPTMMRDAWTVPQELPIHTPAHNHETMIQTPLARFPAQQKIFPGWSGNVAVSSYGAPRPAPQSNYHRQPEGYSTRGDHAQSQQRYGPPLRSTAGYNGRRSYPVAPRLLQFTPPPGSRQAPYSSQGDRGSVYVPRSQRREAGGNGRGIPRFQNNLPPSTAPRRYPQQNHYHGYGGY